MFHFLTLSFHLFFFFNDTATTEIYTLCLHDALPIFVVLEPDSQDALKVATIENQKPIDAFDWRSEEHTSELQSRPHLVCRLLLEKKKKTKHHTTQTQKQKKKQPPTTT